MSQLYFVFVFIFIYLFVFVFVFARLTLSATSTRVVLCLFPVRGCSLGSLLRVCHPSQVPHLVCVLVRGAVRGVWVCARACFHFADWSRLAVCGAPWAGWGVRGAPHALPASTCRVQESGRGRVRAFAHFELVCVCVCVRVYVGEGRDSIRVQRSRAPLRSPQLCLPRARPPRHRPAGSTTPPRTRTSSSCRYPQRPRTGTTRS